MMLSLLERERWIAASAGPSFGKADASLRLSALGNQESQSYTPGALRAAQYPSSCTTARPPGSACPSELLRGCALDNRSWKPLRLWLAQERSVPCLPHHALEVLT